MKKIIVILILGSLSVLTGWMAWKSYQKVSVRQKIEAGLSSLPHFQFLNLDSLPVPLDRRTANQSLILIYFNSECAHCREQAKQIVEDHILMEGTDIFFLSLEDMKKIREFDRDFGLNGFSGVYVGKIDEHIAFDILGITTSPQIYIYNHEGHLEKKFNGTTKPETLIKYANR